MKQKNSICDKYNSPELAMFLEKATIAVSIIDSTLLIRSRADFEYYVGIKVDMNRLMNQTLHSEPTVLNWAKIFNNLDDAYGDCFHAFLSNDKYLKQENLLLMLQSIDAVQTYLKTNPVELIQKDFSALEIYLNKTVQWFQVMAKQYSVLQYVDIPDSINLEPEEAPFASTFAFLLPLAESPIIQGIGMLFFVALAIAGGVLCTVASFGVFGALAGGGSIAAVSGGAIMAAIGGVGFGVGTFFSVQRDSQEQCEVESLNHLKTA